MSDTLQAGPVSHPVVRGEIAPDAETMPARRPPLPVVLVLLGLLVLAAVVGAGGWLVLQGSGAAAPQTQRAAVGSRAPDFTLTNAQTGQPVTLSSLRGKPVWINFWASWCQACRDEMPTMQQAYDKYRSAGLVVLGVNIQESPEAVRQFASSHAYNWTFLLDSDGHITDRYYVGGIPTHVFIGPDGTIRAIQIGDVRPNLDSLLATIVTGSR